MTQVVVWWYRSLKKGSRWFAVSLTDRYGDEGSLTFLRVGRSNKQRLVVRLLNNFMRERLDENGRGWPHAYDVEYRHETVKLPNDVCVVLMAIAEMRGISRKALNELRTLDQIRNYVAVIQLLRSRVD